MALSPQTSVLFLDQMGRISHHSAQTFSKSDTQLEALFIPIASIQIMKSE